MDSSTHVLRLKPIECPIIDGAPEENMRYIEALLAQQMGGGDEVDIIMLPELVLTGYILELAQFATTMESETVSRFSAWANDYNAAIYCSLAIIEDERLYNRALFFHPDGKIEYADKRHLFTMGGERKQFSPGNNRSIISFRGWRIAPFVCYDLRFPAWSRYQQGAHEYDLALYTASWPSVRISVWDKLLPARAIENSLYVAAVNRIGSDSQGLEFNGHATAINYLGTTMTPVNGIYTLDYDGLSRFRKRFPVAEDADKYHFD